jgi:hypothetical protein
MRRQSIMLESAPNPRGNVAQIGKYLEPVLEAVTDRNNQNDGATLGLVHAGLSHLTGALAKQTIAGWAGHEVDEPLVREVLHEVMVQCVLLLEAMDNKA